MRPLILRGSGPLGAAACPRKAAGSTPERSSRAAAKVPGPTLRAGSRRLPGSGSERYAPGSPLSGVDAAALRGGTIAANGPDPRINCGVTPAKWRCFLFPRPRKITLQLSGLHAGVALHQVDAAEGAEEDDQDEDELERLADLDAGDHGVTVAEAPGAPPGVAAPETPRRDPVQTRPCSAAKRRASSVAVSRSSWSSSPSRTRSRT